MFKGGGSNGPDLHGSISLRQWPLAWFACFWLRESLILVILFQYKRLSAINLAGGMNRSDFYHIPIIPLFRHGLGEHMAW